MALTTAESRFDYLAVLFSRNSAGVASSAYYATGDTGVPADVSLRLKQPLSLEQHLWGRLKTRGRREMHFGEVRLNNSDSALDSLFDGTRCFDGENYQLQVYKDRTLLAGLGSAYYLQQPTLSSPDVVFGVRDGVFVLDKSVVTRRFGGTNVLPNGLDGTASDIKGRVIPWPLGIVKNWSPPCVNTTRQIYQLSAFQLQSGWSVSMYVGRVQLTQGLSRTLTEMQSGYTALSFTVDPATEIFTATGHGYSTGDAVTVLATGGSLPAPLVSTAYYYVRVLSANTFTLHPTASDASANTNIINITSAGSGTLDVATNRTAQTCWDYCNDATNGFYARLGTQPDKAVTSDLNSPVAAATAGRCTPSPSSNYAVSALFQALLEVAWGSSATTNSSNCTDAHTSQSGIVIEDDLALLDALNEVAASIGLSFASSASSSSAYSLVELKDPSTSSPTLSVEEHEIDDLQLVESGDDDGGVPVWRVNVEWGRSYTVQTRSDVSASVALSDTEFTANEFRTYVAEDTSVKTQWQRSPEVTFRTNLATEAQAQAFANRMLALLKVWRRFTALRCSLGDPTAAFPIPGTNLTATHSRFGFSAGKKVLVLGRGFDLAANKQTLYCWC